MRTNIKVDITALKVELLARIDAEAKAFWPSTQSVHADKEREALAVVANPIIADAETPFLTCEAIRVEDSRFNVAVVILTRAHHDRQTAALIDGVRGAAKDAVRAAKGVGAARRAALIDWSPVTNLPPET